MFTSDAYEALFGCNHSGGISRYRFASCVPFPFSTSGNDMSTMLVCATRWLSMHLYTLAYMSMHESCLLVCRPCFNIVKLWTFNPNLHLSPVDTTFCCLLTCLPSRLFACFLAYLPFSSLVCLSCCLSCLLPHSMLTSLVRLFALYPLRIIRASLSFHCLSVGSCLCLCMYTHGARTHGARAQSPKCKQKRAWIQACG